MFRKRIRLDPHSVWAWIRDPDPYLESGSGFWIQMSKNRCNKPKFTMTDSIFYPLRTRTEKWSDGAEILTTVPSHFFNNLLLLAIFYYLALLKSYHIECKLIFLTFLTAHCLKISLKILFYSSAYHPRSS